MSESLIVLIDWPNNPNKGQLKCVIPPDKENTVIRCNGTKVSISRVESEKTILKKMKPLKKKISDDCLLLEVWQNGVPQKIVFFPVKELSEEILSYSLSESSSMVTELRFRFGRITE